MKNPYLSLFALWLFSLPMTAQQEGNFSIAARTGLFGANVSEVFPVGRLDPQLDQYSFEPQESFGVKGQKSTLEFRYATGGQAIFSGSLNVASGNNDDWESVEATHEPSGRTFILPGEADLITIGAEIGAYIRFTRPGSWFDFQVGGLATYSLYQYNYTAALRVDYDDRSNRISTDVGTITERGGWKGLAPAIRIGARPLPRFGLLIDASAGVQFNGDDTAGYYSLQGGIYYEFGRN